MIRKLTLLKASGQNPYHNQAIEKFLLDSCEEGEMILYLWANDNTVFIGKNQNAFSECRLALLKEDGGFLARRFTGGGAVYHDGGNLNFTFIARKEDYSLSNQFDIFCSALRSFGLSPERTGRNDVLLQGKKISGNAFYRSEKNCLHHGTILIRSDKEKIERYLSVNRAKLSAKGVESVKSRVGTLSEFDPNANKKEVSLALQEAFFNRYPSASFREMQEEEINSAALSKLEREFSDERYLLGDNVSYSYSLEHKFCWGFADIRFSLSGRKIERARIYSDCLEPSLVEEKERLLKGADLSGKCDPRISDIIEILGEQL